MSAYDNAHRAVIVARGPARESMCVDCGGRAHDWSLRHDAAVTHIDPVDGVYSLRIADYEPRCRSCHHRYDGTASNLGTDFTGAANGFYGHHHREESKRYGERNPAAKVTAAIVIEIRRRAAAGEQQSALAMEFGLQKMQVSRIVRRERWKHVA